MLYTLACPDGATRKFHILACAELYQGVYGGDIHTQDDSTINDLEFTVDLWDDEVGIHKPSS